MVKSHQTHSERERERLETIENHQYCLRFLSISVLCGNISVEKKKICQERNYLAAIGYWFSQLISSSGSRKRFEIFSPRSNRVVKSIPSGKKSRWISRGFFLFFRVICVRRWAEVTLQRGDNDSQTLFLSLKNEIKSSFIIVLNGIFIPCTWNAPNPGASVFFFSHCASIIDIHSLCCNSLALSRPVAFSVLWVASREALGWKERKGRIRWEEFYGRKHFPPPPPVEWRVEVGVVLRRISSRNETCQMRS